MALANVTSTSSTSSPSVQVALGILRRNSTSSSSGSVDLANVARPAFFGGQFCGQCIQLVNYPLRLMRKS